MDNPLFTTALLLLSIALMWYGFLLRRNAKRFSEDSEQRIEQNRAKLSRTTSDGSHSNSSPVEGVNSYYGANRTVQPDSIWAFNPDELVSTIIMTAGFAILSTLTMNWFTNVVLDETKDTTCVVGANVYNVKANSDSKKVCDSVEAKTFGSSSSYTGRR